MKIGDYSQILKSEDFHILNFPSIGFFLDKSMVDPIMWTRDW